MEKVKEKEAERIGEPSLMIKLKPTTEFTDANVGVEELPPTPIEQPPIEGGAIEGEEAPPEEEEFSLEDSQNICQAMWNIPSVIFGEHLVLDGSQTNSFAKQFHIYCEKKGINPYDYFFDEFGLIMVAIPIVQYMRKQHIEFKETEEKKETEKLAEIAKEGDVVNERGTPAEREQAAKKGGAFGA